MADKRNPTEHTEERSGRGSSDGPARLPDDAEHAEYTGYQKEEGGEGGERGEGDRGEEAEARREAELQPGGAGDRRGTGASEEGGGKPTTTGGGEGPGPEQRRVRGKPGTEAAKRVERERDRTGLD